MKNWLYASATAMAAGIRAGEISSEDLVEAHLARIDAVNPQLNAVVTHTEQSARQLAKDADRVQAQGVSWGPLHGVPMTLKDSFDTAGVMTTGGLDTGRANIPRQDACVVQRLKAAGAILLGKTNTPALTLSFETNNHVFGRTNNPYDLERTPGGSSGGAAAIIAAGGSPFDIGSDTGGSIRQPAHNCGIAGLKPTSGRVPRTGHLISFDGHLESLTQPGPMARFVEDLNLLMPIIAGVDWRDPSIVPMPWPSPGDVSLRGLRVAWYTNNHVVSAQQDACDTIANIVTSLADRGVMTAEACPPEAAMATTLFDALFAIDDYAWVQRIRQRRGESPWPTEDSHSASQTTALLESWQLFRSRMFSFIEEYDVILSPVFTHPAQPHDTMGQDGLGDGYGLLNLYNLVGWPVAVVRAGTSDEGLPLGVQIAAKPWREDVALAVAAHIEQQFGGWIPPDESILTGAS